MKKLYTKTALVLASATLLVFSVGCTNEELVSEPVANYEEHFKETFGDVDPTHDWSMATPVTASIDLSNAPEGIYEVKIYSEKTGYLLKKAIVQNAAQLHFDAIKGEESVYVLARSTANLDLTAINGFFPVENGVVKSAATTYQLGNTRVGSPVYKNGSLKTTGEYVYVADNLIGDTYATKDLLSLPTDDGIYYIMKLEGEDYSEGANGKYSVTKNGTTTLMDMYQIYDRVIKNHEQDQDVDGSHFLMYKIVRTEIFSNGGVYANLWKEEWNTQEGTVVHYVNEYNPPYYSRIVDIYLIANTQYYHPAYYRSPFNTTETYNSWVVACEDLGGSYDYDFNDIVFDLGLVDIATTTTGATSSEERAELYLHPLAAGGTKPAYIYYDMNGDEYFGEEELVGEIHDLLRGAPTNVPINVGGSWDIDPTMIERIKLADVDMSQNTQTAYINQALQRIGIFVDNDHTKGAIEVKAPTKDGSPQMLLLPRGWDWPNEMVSIFNVYPLFKDWTTDQTKNGWITTPQGNFHQNPLK